MSEIKRYAHASRNYVMTPHEAGAFVRYVDHAEALTTERTAREAAEAAVARMEGELAGLRRDAIRYRWLRDNSGDADYPFIAGKPGEPYAGEGWLCGTSADIAVDAEIAKDSELRALLEGGAGHG